MRTDPLETVFIKAMVRNPALIENSLLVFKTLRVGFPDNKVVVCTDNPEVEKEARGVDCQVHPNNLGEPHDCWIASLIEAGDEPFWICDTDIIFHAKINYLDGGRLAGPLEPEHWCPYTKAWHTERLHTCLMRIDPEAVRTAELAFWRDIARTPWDSRHELVSQSWSPGRPLRFHDTMSRLYQAIGGVPFDAHTLAAFSHLHAGTFADLLAKEYPDMARAHAHFHAHPETSKGLWKAQLKAQARARPKPQLAGDPLLTHQP